MSHRTNTVALLALTSAGCASLDAGPDYARVVRHVTAATGETEVYRPDDDEAVRSAVDALIADGITTAEAVRVALLNNPSLQARFFRVGIARADFAQSSLFSNPALALSLRLPSGGGLGNFQVGLAQNLADLWQIPIRKRAASHALDQAVLDLARAAADLVTDVQEAYYAAAAARRTLEIAAEDRGLAGRTLEIAEKRVAAGAGSTLDVNLARAPVLEAELSQETARLALADTRWRLATHLGLETLDAVPLRDALPALPDATLDAARLVELARTHRLDLRAARAAADVLRARIEHQRQLVFPDLTLGVALERGERKRQPSANPLADIARASLAAGAFTLPSGGAGATRNTDAQTIVGPTVNLTLPVFDQNQAQIARAVLAWQQANKTLDALDRRLGPQVRRAVDQATTAWRVVRLYRDRFLPLAEKNLTQTRKSYEAGTTPFLTVLEAQRFLLNTRRRSVEVHREAATTIPQLVRTVGRPWPELLAEPAVDTAPTQSNHGDKK